MANEQINVPSLVLILVLSGLIIRYLFFSPPGGAPAGAPRRGQGPGGRDSLSALRQREAAVERIQQMFPQVERRTVLWDLQRNGGNIAATTERILAGRLETVSTRLLLCLCVCVCVRARARACVHGVIHRFGDGEMLARERASC